MPFSGTGTGIQNASDVFFSGLAANNTLKYDSVTSKWTNATASVTKSDIGLSNVDNTSDAAKPISTATQSALDSISNDVSVRPVRLVYNSSWPSRPSVTYAEWVDPTGLAPAPSAMIDGDTFIQKAT